MPKFFEKIWPPLDITLVEEIFQVTVLRREFFIADLTLHVPHPLYFSFFVLRNPIVFFKGQKKK